jgi:hypothetical protein
MNIERRLGFERLGEPWKEIEKEKRKERKESEEKREGTFVKNDDLTIHHQWQHLGG